MPIMKSDKKMYKDITTDRRLLQELYLRYIRGKFMHENVAKCERDVFGHNSGRHILLSPKTWPLK